MLWPCAPRVKAARICVLSLGQKRVPNLPLRSCATGSGAGFGARFHGTDGREQCCRRRNLNGGPGGAAASRDAIDAKRHEKKADGPERRWNLHVQNTDIVQGYPPFSARYSGPNSLPSAGEARETVSLDLMAGFRLLERSGGLRGRPHVAGIRPRTTCSASKDFPAGKPTALARRSPTAPSRACSFVKPSAWAARGASGT